MKKLGVNIVAIFFLLFLAVCFNARSQGPGRPPQGGPPPQFPPQGRPPQNPFGDPDVPITGLEFLLVGGGLLGGYRILKRKKNLNES